MYWATNEHFCLQSCIRNKINGNCEDLGEFDEGQIVVAIRFDRSISKSAALRFPIVRICQSGSHIYENVINARCAAVFLRKESKM